jgi:hypothetical protein
MGMSRAAKPEDGRARFLGYFSLGLGTPQVTAPGAVNRLIGVRDQAGTRFWQVVVGMRELMAAAGILGSRRPAGWAWARVAGDAMDITLLSSALRGKADHPERTVAALGAVAGITVADVMQGIRLSLANGNGQAIGGTMHVAEAITIHAPQAEVEHGWTEHVREAGFTENVENLQVRFAAAPGDRGTEIHLSFDHLPALGPVGAVVGKVKGDDPGMAAKYELRRYKQLVETGEVVRSDGTPEGQIPGRMLKQRPAQPVAAAS